MAEQTALWAEPPQRIQDDGLDVTYESDFVPAARRRALLSALITESDWHRPAMHFGGKTMYTRRQVAWHADRGYVYQYSGQEHVWRPWTSAMLELRALVERRMGRGFNGVLLNLYESGDDHVSFHADDERDMDDGVPVVAVSLGAKRDFVFRHENGNRYTLPLDDGSLVIMDGATQKVSKHSIPKRAGVTDPRVSLTFRQCIRKVQ